MWSASRLLMIVAINAMFPLLSVAQNESTQANTVVPDSTMNAVSRVTRLSEKEAHLNEVIVEGSNRIEKEDKVVYLPTRHQRSAAHNVANLLFNMMIPQIDVSLTDGSVKSLDGSRLLVCIDGRAAIQSELTQVRAKDVLRVEYDDHPTGLYASYDRVLNIVMKRHTSGGYVDASARQQLIAPSGKYTVQASFDSPKGNLLALAGHTCSTLDNTGSSGMAYYHLDEDFSKYAHTTDGLSDTRGNYGLLRQTWRGMKSMLLAQGSLSWSRSPWNRTQTDIAYTTDRYPDSPSVTQAYSRNLAPSVYLYHNLMLDKTQQFYWTLTYTYSDDSYQRNYHEGTSAPIISNSKSLTHTADLKAGYTKAFKNGGSLSLLLWQLYTCGNADYLGTHSSHQELNSYDLLLIPTYNYRFNSHLTLGLQFGFDVNTYRVNDDKRITNLWLRPGLTGRWSPNPTSSLTLSVYGGNTSPQLAAMSDAVQQVSPYELTQGNPKLDLGKIVNGNIAYSRYFKKVSCSTYLSYNGIYNMPGLYYAAMGSLLVSQYRNTGDFHNLSIGTSVSYSPFKGFSLRPNITFLHTSRTGYAAAHSNALSYGMTVQYVAGNFSLSVIYGSPVKTLSTESFTKMRAQYSLMASYRCKSLLLQAGCNQLLDRRKALHSYFDYGCYSFDSQIVSNAVNQRVWLSLAYSFDFGRKVQRQQVDVNKGNSMILKP